MVLVGPFQLRYLIILYDSMSSSLYLALLQGRLYKVLLCLYRLFGMAHLNKLAVFFYYSAIGDVIILQKALVFSCSGATKM